MNTLVRYVDVYGAVERVMITRCPGMYVPHLAISTDNGALQYSSVVLSVTSR